MTVPLLAAAVLCSVAVAFLSSAAEGKVHHHTWDISYRYKSPDCFEKLAVTINGEFPGPTIRATQGDTLVVTVNNHLETENTGIHWHGIRQIGSPWADGTVGVTQCPILPGETFTYRFVVDRPGTYLYHAHYGMQRVAGIDGMIVVSVPEGVAEPFAYVEEHTVLLMDWWHKSVYEQAVGLASDPLVFVNEPQSLLINGRGRFNCSSQQPAAGGSSSSCNASRPDCSPLPTLFTAVPGRTYRLRVGSLTSLSSLNFEIEGHSMTVVEADGHYVKPVVVKSLFVYSGETYSVLVRADQDPSRSYWAASHVVGRERKTPSAMAVLRYATAAGPTTTPPPTAQPAGPAWDDAAPRVQQSRSIVAHPDHVEPPPATADRTLLLLNTQNRIDNLVKWAVNGVSLKFPATPFLVSMKRGLRGAYDDQRPPADTPRDYRSYDVAKPPTANGTVASTVYRLALGSVVDVVLQNAKMLNNKTETHPWHLHGHNFWVLAYGDGKFDPETDTARFNLRDPIMKNTVPLHPMGWTAVRFRTDNPGVWLFHCHVEAHVHMGMGVVFEEGVDKLGRLPSSIMGCGRSKGLH